MHPAWTLSSYQCQQSAFTKELCGTHTIWMCFHQVIFITGPTGYDLQHMSETRMKFISHSLFQVRFDYHTILSINRNTIQWNLLEIKLGLSQHFIWKLGPPTAIHWNDITVHKNYNNYIFPAGLMTKCYLLLSYFMATVNCGGFWSSWCISLLLHFLLCYNSQTPAMFLSQSHHFQGILWCI